MEQEFDYILHVGEAGAPRLELLDRAYGPSSRQLLLRAGLRKGMRVLDVGCGTGTMACWIAAQVGPGGSVVGIDGSRQQVECAEQAARAARLENTRFLEGSAYELSDAGDGFDIVYTRFLLMHLERPGDALRQMRERLAVAGTLVCEDASVDTSFCEPPSDAQRRLTALAMEAARERGQDFAVARRLYHLVREAGFEQAEVSQHQPVFVRGPEKRLEELSFREVAGQVVRAGLATAEEVEVILGELERVGKDESVLYSLSRMTQVWAHR
jgi:ubiquinone/menaquinone biosynthesis C-methylase UbiE